MFKSNNLWSILILSWRLCIVKTLRLNGIHFIFALTKWDFRLRFCKVSLLYEVLWIFFWCMIKCCRCLNKFDNEGVVEVIIALQLRKVLLKYWLCVRVKEWHLRLPVRLQVTLRILTLKIISPKSKCHISETINLIYFKACNQSLWDSCVHQDLILH